MGTRLSLIDRKRSWPLILVEWEVARRVPAKERCDDIVVFVHADAEPQQEVNEDQRRMAR